MSIPSSRSLPDPLRDGLATVVGIGILGYQRLQVRRREYEKTHGVTVPMTPAEMRDLLRRRCARG